MNNKQSLSNIERENESTKTIFNFTQLQEKNSAGRINKFLSFFQNSKSGPNYFIKLIDHYSLCRVQYPNLSKLFVKCIFFCYPETTEENKTLIKKQTEGPKNIIFPEEFQQKKSTGYGFSQKNQECETKMNDLFSFIQKDDENSFDSFLKSNQEFYIQKPFTIERDNKYFPFLIKENHGVHLLHIIIIIFQSLISVVCLVH